MEKNIKFLSLLLLFLLNANCNPPQKQTPEAKAADQVVSPTSPLPERGNNLHNNDNITFPWLSSYNKANILKQQIPAPQNATRTKSQPRSLATWLRHLPLHPPSTKVNLYNGKLKANQNAHHRVIHMDVGTRDLQQCADAVMRLKAEYHFYKKEYDKIHFNYTSGDEVSFDDWRFGRKPKVLANKVFFTGKSETADNSYPNFKKYMQAVFNYAGTASLEKELQQVSFAAMEIGDVFIQGGFPGHAVLVMDMAEEVATGKKYFLLAQSYMPAQEMHILKNPMDAELSPWYALDFGGDIRTPEWGFAQEDLMRFRE